MISAEELNDIVDRDDVKLIDFRNLPAFVTGHIPGAVQIDRSALEDGDADVGLMAASREKTAAVLGENGISPSDTIVVYCDNGLWGARAWWLLTMYGHEDVRLLDGGLDRWKDLDYSTRETEYHFMGPANAGMVATLDDVRAAMDNDTIILDTRGWGEFTGENVLSDAAQGGRVPGAVWTEWTEALNDDGTFKSAAEMAEIYEVVGITGDRPVITYCQGGVRAAHSLFALTELLGFDNIANYDGSWLEWSNAADVPIMTGE